MRYQRKQSLSPNKLTQTRRASFDYFLLIRSLLFKTILYCYTPIIVQVNLLFSCCSIFILLWGFGQYSSQRPNKLVCTRRLNFNHILPTRSHLLKAFLSGRMPIKNPFFSFSVPQFFSWDVGDDCLCFLVSLVKLFYWKYIAQCFTTTLCHVISLFFFFFLLQLHLNSGVDYALYEFFVIGMTGNTTEHS